MAKRSTKSKVKNGNVIRKNPTRKKNPELESLLPQLNLLNLYAVNIRYPGAAASKQKALQCVNYAQEARLHLRRALNL